MTEQRNEAPIPDIPGPVEHPARPGLRLPAGSCDTHAHIFGPAEDYPYSPTREYTPPDASLQRYAGLLHHLGFERAVLVQPSVYGTDNRRLLDALRDVAHDSLGIRWRGIAVTSTTVADDTLQAWHALGVRGLRLNLIFQGAEVDFSQARELASRIAPLGWHLQFLIDISRFGDFARQLSELPVPAVIDHMGHFDAQLGTGHPAFRDLIALLKEGRCWVKLSGPNRTSALDRVPFDDVQPIARELLTAAPERMVFGTDWPHVRLRTSMPDDGALVDELGRWTNGDATLLKQVLVDNPAELYGF